MPRSLHCVSAAALALLLAAAPATAIGLVDRDSPEAGASRTGWLTALADWVRCRLGDLGPDAPRLVTASDETPPAAPPPPANAEPPANSETDGGPHWDPGS